MTKDTGEKEESENGEMLIFLGTYIYHSLWMVCSGFFLVTPLNDMFLERSWPIETEYLFKKIPPWHYLLVIFSKNWKYISKIIGNLKYGAKSKMEIFCKKFFMKFFMVQNVFWNFKNQYNKFLEFFILKIFHKPDLNNSP